MKNLHTPGPWKLEYDYSLVMPFKRGNYIVTSGPIGPSEADRDELRANARLIAAAPELLEALDEAFNEITTLNNILYKRNIYDLEISAVRQRELIDRILGAIQKATSHEAN